MTMQMIRRHSSIKTDAERRAEARAERTRFEIAWHLPAPEFRRASENVPLSWWLDTIHKTQRAALARLSDLTPIIRAGRGFCVVIEVVLAEHGSGFESEKIVAIAPTAPPNLPERSDIGHINPAIQSAFNKLQDQLRVRLPADGSATTAATQRAMARRRRERRTKIGGVVGFGALVAVVLYSVMFTNLWQGTERAVVDMSGEYKTGRIVTSVGGSLSRCTSQAYDAGTMRGVGEAKVIECPPEAVDESRFNRIRGGFNRR